MPEPDETSTPVPDEVSTAAERSAYAAPDSDESSTDTADEVQPASESQATTVADDASAPPVEPGTGQAPASPETPAPRSEPAGPGFLERLPWWAVPAVLVGVPILVALAVQVDPQVYDDFVWKYYWGPIKADADNVGTLVHNGVAAHSGYNVVNTLTWAALLGVCIVGIAQMLTRFRTTMDDRLILAATAWVVVGSAAHVLEDAGLLSGWLQYFFITPPIYLLFAAFGIASFLVGQWMKSVADRNPRPDGSPNLHAALRILWLVHIVAVLVWLALWLKAWPNITAYVNPVWVAGFAVANFLVARHFTLKHGKVDPSLLTLLLSLGTYLLVGAYVVTYVVDPWNTLAREGIPSASITAPILALAATGLVYAVAKWRLSKGSKVAAAFVLPINLLIVFAQTLDAFATAIGVDLAGYEEKHVLSGWVIDSFRDFSQGIGWEFGVTYPTFLAFATLKLAVSLAVIYAIDVQSKDEAERNPTLIGLVKFAIIMVGIGPGVRNMVRLSLGV